MGLKRTAKKKKIGKREKLNIRALGTQRKNKKTKQKGINDGD